VKRKHNAAIHRAPITEGSIAPMNEIYLDLFASILFLNFSDINSA